MEKGDGANPVSAKGGSNVTRQLPKEVEVRSCGYFSKGRRRQSALNVYQKSSEQSVLIEVSRRQVVYSDDQRRFGAEYTNCLPKVIKRRAYMLLTNAVRDIACTLLTEGSFDDYESKEL